MDSAVALRPVTSEVGEAFLRLALRGLTAACTSPTRFAQTVRGVPSPDGPVIAAEGDNLRYAAMAALGLAQTQAYEQRSVLHGGSLDGLVDDLVVRGREHSDPGAVALVTWAAAEISGRIDAALLRRLDEFASGSQPIPTVDLSWILTAATASRPHADTAALAQTARDRLLAGQGPAGIFPHGLPASSQGRLRAHVGSFADQIYPVQALARHHGAVGDDTALAAADRTARRLCELQGEAGQWWWHYDVRDGSVVEAYPVYSVHQHAMAPMGLLDLLAAGGEDHRAEIRLGVDWLRTHPESFEPLVDERHGLIWRKVGRREPPKAARRLNAVTTAVRPGLRAPGLDRAFPPGPVDHECRPYELGWLLYAWLRPGAWQHLTGEPRHRVKVVVRDE